MPDLNLPIPGVTPGTGWASQLNAAITDINDVIETGRLSEPGLIATITAQRIVQSRIVAPTGGQWTDLNAVDAALPVVLDVRAGALNRPVTIPLTGWHIPSAGSDAVQALTTVGGGSPQQWVRARTSGVWGAWLRVVDQGVLDARVQGLIAELDLVTLVKCVHLEAGVWVWDGPDAPAATHYLLPDDTGALIARPTPFPVPSATSPALDW